MNEHFNTSDIVERTDQNTNSPVINSDPFADKDPMDETVVHKAPTSETNTQEAPIGSHPVSSTALLNHEESEHFRTRWNEIQGKFVDEPRASVQQADVLVSDVIEHITQIFTNERHSLEGQWKQGDDVSTEDLRKALQSYRSFFNRLMV